MRPSTNLSSRVMKSVPLAPSLDQDLHFVLCGFGRAGLAYVETDPTEADATEIADAKGAGRSIARGRLDFLGSPTPGEFDDMDCSNRNGAPLVTGKPTLPPP